jgi:hypothetical protein
VIRRAAPLLLGVLAVVGAGCGGASSTSMTSDAARQLAARDQSVHVALATGDRAAIDQSIASLRQTVATLEGKGQLSVDRAKAILAAVNVVQTDLVLLPTTTTTTTTTTPVPPHGDHGPKDHGGGKGD